MTDRDNPIEEIFDQINGNQKAESIECDDFNIGRVITISIGHAVQDGYTSFLAPLLPLLISNLSLSMTNAGFLAVFLRAPSLLQPAIGRLADRISLRYLFILAPGVSATMMSLLGVASGYSMLAVLLVITGFSTAALHAIGPVMAGRISGKNIGRGMGFWSLGGEFGKTLGPIVIVNTVSYLTLRGTPILMIGGWLTTVILFVQLRSVQGSPVRTAEEGKWWHVLKTMKKILVPVSGIIVAISFIDSALFIYLPTYLLEMGADFWFAGASLSIFQAAGVFGAFSGGLLSDRLGRRFVLGLALLTTPFFMFIFLHTSGWSQIGVVAVMGITSLSIQPAIMALIFESFPDNRAYANGIYMALSFGINASSALLIGIMGDLFGLRQAYISSAIIMLFGLPLVLLLPSRKNLT